jgi:phosphate transport system substrate-binding protein
MSKISKTKYCLLPTATAYCRCLLLLPATSLLLFSSCNDYYKNDYIDNSPTSGKLKIYHSEGLQLHIKNQAFTFSSLYPKASVECVAACEAEIIDAFLKDSCKAIIINRLLGENEKKAFDQKQLHPAYSPLAKTGVALITSVNTKFSKFRVDEIKKLLSAELSVKDSAGNMISPIAVLDTKCSSVSYYLRDSVIQSKQFGPKCFAVNNTAELLQKIADNPNHIGFIDFAWLSDRDDSIYKAYQNKIKFMAVGRTDSIYFEPNQSSFKTGEYPFTRTIYLLRRSDDFSLAKGFEAFMAGPKGQLIFLKQGLLPVRQSERIIEVKMEPIAGQK